MFQNPYFAHNLAPTEAKVCEIKTTPQNRSFSRCILRQTGSLVGSNGRIEPNYFLYRDASFLAGKKSCFFGSPGCVRLLQAARDRFYDKKLIFYEKNRAALFLSGQPS